LELKFIKGIGEKRAEAFKKIGVNRLEDFAEFIPRDYIKRISIYELNHHTEKLIAISGKVTNVRLPKKSNHPIVLSLTDETGTAEIPIFGRNEFRSKQFRINQDYIFCGKPEFTFYSDYPRINYRDHLPINLNENDDLVFLKYPYLPVYELPGELKKTWIKILSLSKILFSAFKYLSRENILDKETIPENIQKELNLSSRKNAVLRINFPLSESDIEISRRRLAFEELFYLQILMSIRKKINKNETKGIEFSYDDEKFREEFKKEINFTLTDSQEAVIKEILNDMKSKNVMNRLLQGDVGSGKTIVALYCMLIAVKNGFQAAIMCPTEILAEQHYKYISEICRKLDIKIELLTGSIKGKIRKEVYSRIESGEAQIIVGTHTLVQEKIKFHKLGFAVIDEQHKFGVLQRAKFKEKGYNPDMLIMTATPIPRTLSLAYYGDLEISTIKELPKNRIPIKTFLRTEEEKKNVTDFITDEIKKGRQAFIVYPIIDESEKLDLKSAIKEYEFLKNSVFKGIETGLLHGKMKQDEKEEIMSKFKKNEIKILVSTTVIEVGIDIPNASVMLIEEAQRYGLSQLHQLRGRIGRGSEQSYCILLTNNKSEETLSRLKILCESTDGFYIAEKDLELRGPGEFYGVKQSGEISFSCTDLYKDKDLLESAKKISEQIIEEDMHLRMGKNILIKEQFLMKYNDSINLINVA